MDIYMVNEVGKVDYFLFTINSYYYTPRAVLIDVLNNDNMRDIAYWTVRGKEFHIRDIDNLAGIWQKHAVEETDYSSPPAVYFGFHIYNACDISDVLTREYNERLVLAMRSSNDTRSTCDLTPGHFYEFLIRFLIEQSRVDFCQWLDVDNKEFQILDILELGRYYMDINHMGAFNLSVIQFILRSYCDTGILIPINPATYHYQFDHQWFEKEIMKAPTEKVGFMPFSAINAAFDFW